MNLSLISAKARRSPRCLVSFVGAYYLTEKLKDARKMINLHTQGSGLIFVEY